MCWNTEESEKEKSIIARRSCESIGGGDEYCINDQVGSVMDVSRGETGTLRAQAHGNNPIVLTMYDNHQADARITGPLEVANSVVARYGTGGNNTPIVIAQKKDETFSLSKNSFMTRATEEETDALVATNYKDGTVVVRRKVARRITPLECERLQGFPDGWTDIGEWTDSKGKKHKSTDAMRFKALGNSIAIPFWKVLARKIAAQYDRDITMGSLFDGIGGFPIAFEHCGSKAVWSSEIDEFPDAVSRHHFPER